MMAMASRRGTQIAAALGIAAIPADANAHLVTTGLGPLYDGALHFMMSPEAIIPVVALGIFSGLQGLVHVRAAVLILPITWILSGFVRIVLGPQELNPAYESLPLIVFGGLAAANPSVHVRVCALLALLLGLVEGYMFGLASGEARGGVLQVFGAASVVFVLITLVSAAVLKVPWDWNRTAFRVVGSWTAACGLLLLGWGLR